MCMKNKILYLQSLKQESQCMTGREEEVEVRRKYLHLKSTLILLPKTSPIVFNFKLLTKIVYL